MSLTSEPTEPIAKRLKPPPTDHDQTLVHCPRCDSSNTKFCYYNNYSLTQPRYFCKSCRRYWTKGGTLRNIPIGGVSRKNKKIVSVSGINHHHRRLELQPQPQPQQQQNSHYDKVAILSDGTTKSPNSIGLQLSQPESPSPAHFENPEFMFEDLTIDFMERGRDYDNGVDYFLSTGGNRLNTGYGAVTNNMSNNIRGPGLFGESETMSYYDGHCEKLINGEDVKPKLFDLEWREQTGCYSGLHGGYLLGLGSSWVGLVSGYGSSSTNPLV